MKKLYLDSYSELIVKAMNAATWKWNVQTGELIVNRRWSEMIGYDTNDLPLITIKTFYDNLHPDDLKYFSIKFQNILDSHEEFYSLSIRRKHKDGHWVHVLDNGRVVKWDRNGKPLIAIGAHIDITEQITTAEKLQISEQNFREIIENTKSIIYRLDLDGNFIFLSKAWTTLLGHHNSEVMGLSFRPFVHPSDLQKVNNFLIEIKETTNHHSVYGFRLKNMDGDYRYFESNASPIIQDGVVIGYTGIARDIEELIEKDKAIDYLIYHDQLTKFYNRHYLEKVTTIFEDSSYYPLCFIIADLDNLKLVNDTYGHHAGDEVIARTSECIKSSVPSKYLFRMGGDEFLIIIPNTDETKAKRIIKHISESLRNNCSKNYEISLSMGYSIKENTDKNIFDYIKTADEYMYQNKKQSKL